jgi:hypothetical protein
VRKCVLNSFYSGQGPTGDCCDHENEDPSFTKFGGFGID